MLNLIAILLQFKHFGEDLSAVGLKLISSCLSLQQQSFRGIISCFTLFFAFMINSRHIKGRLGEKDDLEKRAIILGKKS